MKTHWSDGKTPIAYHMCLDDKEIPLNKIVRQNIQLHYTGTIQCIHCHRKINKSFAQGYCYPCFMSLAETDMCIIKPHQCHHHLGTCRDNEFAEKHCFIPHLVYLAISSSPKVGITREHQKFTRWADQGASYATELAIVPNRKIAGELEVELSQHISDKTNWRKMLSAEIPKLNLQDIKAEMVSKLPEKMKSYVVKSQTHQLLYPVQAFPQKISSFNLDKDPNVEGTLMGIKGQYLIFESKVINLRKYQGYHIEISI